MIDYPKDCPHCNKPFTAHRPFTVYCSNACRTGAHRERVGTEPASYASLDESATRAESRAARLRGMAERARKVENKTADFFARKAAVIAAEKSVAES